MKQRDIVKKGGIIGQINNKDISFFSLGCFVKLGQGGKNRLENYNKRNATKTATKVSKATKNNTLSD